MISSSSGSAGGFHPTTKTRTNKEIYSERAEMECKNGVRQPLGQEVNKEHGNLGYCTVDQTYSAAPQPKPMPSIFKALHSLSICGLHRV
jgi:hypothetical protein